MLAVVHQCGSRLAACYGSADLAASHAAYPLAASCALGFHLSMCHAAALRGSPVSLSRSAVQMRAR